MQKAKLIQLLTEHFNVGEIRTLCFELGIDYENLYGTTKKSKVMELVSYAERHGTLSNLITVAQRERPFLFAEFTKNGGKLPQTVTHFHGSVSGPIHTGSGDINLNKVSSTKQYALEELAIPLTVESFQQQLQNLETLVIKAEEQSEFLHPLDTELVMENLVDIREESKLDRPRSWRITRQLEDILDTIQKTIFMFKESGKTVPNLVNAADTTSILILLSKKVF